MTNQEAFNLIWNGLKNQNWRKCVDESDRCVHRGPNGLKCAAGHVFTDEQLAAYTPDKALHRPKLYAANANHVIGSCKLDMSPTFMNRCQWAHDDSSSPKDMQARLQDIAVEFYVTVPE